MRTRIKYCGITRKQDIEIATEVGVDAIGLVFYPPSSRALSLQQAQDLSAAIPAFVTTVALFLNPQETDVREVINIIQPDLLQFHGTESAEFCSQFHRPYIKALALGGADASSSAAELKQQVASHSEARAFLLDSHAPGSAGGTGVGFDWTRAPQNPDFPLVLAGGLQTENVADAVRQVRPYAVDVSSGVESAPGIKDADKMREFANQVRKADES